MMKARPLSSPERRTLSQIARGLRQDPHFASEFEASSRAPARRHPLRALASIGSVLWPWRGRGTR
ncbi:DUF3040 domain-containing protein [Actinomycetota bacterium Odt1-20B]